jgi:hypothetical protein
MKDNSNEHSSKTEKSAPDDQNRRDMIKAAGMAAGSALLGLAPEALMAAGIERETISGPPDHNPSSEYVFSITARISGALTVGDTTTGQVRAIPITGGLVEGPDFDGVVIPGGADWQRTRKDGVTEIEATYAIQVKGPSNVDTLVKVVNAGIIAPPANLGEPGYFRTRIMFDAPAGDFAWMNQAIFLSRVGRHPTEDSAVLVEVFRLI